MPSLSDTLRRRVGPWFVLTAFELRGPRKAYEMLRRALGTRLRLELYFAFDDPYSALAVVQLSELAASRGCDLALFPVVRHGIDGDPDGELRRRHSLLDARRLAARAGLNLSRSQLPEAQDVAFLALWCEAARSCQGRGKGLEEFTVAAMRELWMEGDGSVRREVFAEIYQRACGAQPPAQASAEEAAVKRNEAALKSKGHWETPAVLVAGEWFFAHERLAAIGERLDYLGLGR